MSLDVQEQQNIARQFRRTLSRPALVPLAGMALLALAYLGLIAFIAWAGRWSEQAEEVVAALWRSEKLMVDMETGLRGYQLRADRRFLEPYLLAQPDVRPTMNDLDALIVHPEQRRRLTALRADVAEWTEWGEDARMSVERGAGAVPLEAALEGRARMDTVRRRIDEMRGAEYELREGREQRVWQAVGLAVIASIGLTGALGWWLLRRWRRTLRDTAATYTKAIRENVKQARQIKDAYARLDGEMVAVAGIQRSLLPSALPEIPGLAMAAHYRTSTRVGGDYYDFFALSQPPEAPAATHGESGRWGILIADVSGHGTPAAVVMAVTHTIAHGYEHPPTPPSQLLTFVNRRLCRGYTGDKVAFVTAFFAIYDPQQRRLEYSSAGHNPPRLRRAGTESFTELDAAGGLPLGIDDAEEYHNATVDLAAGDVLAFYTDGITESRNDAGGFFEVERLDAALAGEGTPREMLRPALASVRAHAAGRDPDDDETLIVARVG